MRGRRPTGPDFVQRLHGSDTAKQRLQAVLETLSGQSRVLEACDRLDICEQRFDQIRVEALQAALERLETRPAGRKAQTPTPLEAENRLLQERIQSLEAELHAARVRTEVALALPPHGPAAAEKKTPPRRRGRPPRVSKPT
jgi:hypothetical protein